MNRREALSRVALLFGGTIVGAEAFLTGCRNSSAPAETLTFSPDVISLLDEVVETILPTTASSPGAKAAAIGEFMKVKVKDCYGDNDHEIFIEGIEMLNEASDKKYRDDVMDHSADELHAHLVQDDAEAKSYNKSKTGGD